MMIDSLKVIAKNIRLRKADLSHYDVHKQTLFLRKFSNPKDDLERSFFQYQCQKNLLGWFVSALYRLGSLPLLLYYQNALLKRPVLGNAKHYDTLFLYDSVEEILPASLNTDASLYQIKGFQKNMSLSGDDIAFLFELNKRYPFDWYFRLKCLLKVAIYSYYIRSYQPGRMIVSEEYSFTSSMLTAYCARHHVAHINVMHGEKLFDITDAFFHFSHCYVWDEHYKALFCDLRAEPTQFIIEKSASQLPHGISHADKSVDYTYYLGGETQKKQILIQKNLYPLKAAGYVIAIRPHPRYSNVKDTSDIFHGFLIEDPWSFPIADSLARTKNAISLCSTVLGQAHVNQIRIIIDDVTDPQDYAHLKELRYLYASRPHNKLSDEIKMNAQNGEE